MTTMFSKLMEIRIGFIKTSGKIMSDSIDALIHLSGNEAKECLMQTTDRINHNYQDAIDEFDSTLVTFEEQNDLTTEVIDNIRISIFNHYLSHMSTIIKLFNMK